MEQQQSQTDTNENVGPDRDVDMITMSGAHVWYDHPEYTTVSWEDIRLQTSNICRYNGCLDWKLLKHLALVARLAPIYTSTSGLPNPERAAILAGYAAAHDFHEVYCTDIVSGMKKHIPAYRNLESKWEQYVHSQIGLPWEHRPHEAVHYTDMRALVIEMDCLGHPALVHCAKKFGGLATIREKIIFQSVHDASMDMCWDIVMHAVTSAKEALNKLQQ